MKSPTHTITLTRSEQGHWCNMVHPVLVVCSLQPPYHHLREEYNRITHEHTRKCTQTHMHDCTHRKNTHTRSTTFHPPERMCTSHTSRIRTQSHTRTQTHIYICQHAHTNPPLPPITHTIMDAYTTQLLHTHTHTHTRVNTRIINIGQTHTWTVAVFGAVLLILCDKDSVAHFHRRSLPFPPTTASVEHTQGERDSINFINAPGEPNFTSIK
jgi:hypothetical protein